MLIGEYRHTIDSKKRLALPAKFRKELGQTVVITKWFENCLVVYPEKGYQAVSDKLGGITFAQLAQPETRALGRNFLVGAMILDIDSLGRILIPEYLKDYAGLKKNVVIGGLFNRLEIWDESQWEKYRAQAEKEIGNFAEKLKDLGI